MKMKSFESILVALFFVGVINCVYIIHDGFALKIRTLEAARQAAPALYASNR
jgi:hypothetical protein